MIMNLIDKKYHSRTTTTSAPGSIQIVSYIRVTDNYIILVAIFDFSFNNFILVHYIFYFQLTYPCMCVFRLFSNIHYVRFSDLSISRVFNNDLYDYYLAMPRDSSATPKFSDNCLQQYL